jgi:hypothetical protein
MPYHYPLVQQLIIGRLDCEVHHNIFDHKQTSPDTSNMLASLSLPLILGAHAMARSTPRTSLGFIVFIWRSRDHSKIIPRGTLS